MKVLILLCAVAAVLADDDGRYVPDDSGRYVPDNSGQYIPDNSGLYNDDGTGRYAGDGSGRYSGQNDRYRGGLSGHLLESATSNRQVTQPPIPVVRSPQTPKPQVIDYNRNNYQDGKWKIIRQLGDVDTDGYHWEYETENKIIAEESGKLHNVGTDAEGIRAKGFFQYTGPDNVVYSIVYTADENGFVPQGAHLPTPPPIPEAIAKALEFDRAHNRV